MARIAGFHPAGPGSISGVGEFVFLVLFSRAIYKKIQKKSLFDLIKLTISTHFFNVSTKLYEVLNILTSYENTKLTRSTIKSWKRLIITGLLYKATTVHREVRNFPSSTF